MSLKVVEQYVQTLKDYTKKLNKEKLTVLMQVGEFFEIYGLIYPDGSRVGNVWEFCDNVNLKVALKPQVVYDNPSIQVYMGGVGEAYINPYIQKAVEQFGWTIVIFDQHRIGNTNKFERKEASIISPGININSDNFSNITLIIYMEQVKNYYTNKSSLSLQSKTRDEYSINIGVAFVDCLTGENGIMAINNAPASDISIPLDELLKLLTIKNPNELYIYLNNVEPTQAGTSDEDLVNALHLFNYNFKIYRDDRTQMPENIHKLQYQQALFERVYIRHRGLLDIMQQLGVEGAEHTYSRIALTLIINFIMKHDKTIIEKLSAPEIILNSDKYLMLANNSLEQLDIINNSSTNSSHNSTSNQTRTNPYSKRISLLELLDNTKTQLGKILLRYQLSTPITDEPILNKRYSQVDELLNLHVNYMNSAGNGGSVDKYGSPLYQLRQKLAPIRNIENYLRKVITQKINPCEIAPYIASLDGCSQVYEYMRSNVFTGANTLLAVVPSEPHYNNFQSLVNKFNADVILDNLKSNVWNGIEANPFKKGISKVLDNLQDEIDNDKGFLDTLLLELSKVIDPKFDKSQIASKPLIYIGENASKGIHIFTNTSRKDILEAYFAKPKAELKVGSYRIMAKDINFLKMKESKWEIEITFLKTSNGTLKANLDRIGKLAKQEVLEWLKTNITNQTPILDALNEFARFIAQCDVIQSNTINAIEKGYTKPVIDANATRSCMKADKIRHPIIEYINQSTKYVPNDVSMGSSVGSSVDGILLFGVNAVGKSSLMKSLGINVIMAQAGMYVAASRFEYKPYKYLFTRIRNNDNLYAGLSSFEVEMKEFKVILKYADENSIILGDELAAGTNTEDATAIVASGVIELAKRKSNFLFATHLHFLANMECIKELGNVRMCHLLVERDAQNPKKLIYNRKLLEGNGPSSYGILVCDAMNMDLEFLNRAKSIRESIDITKTASTQIAQTAQTAVIGSKYNKNKVISKCEVCLVADACDVHHINQQCDANSCNLIDDIELGIFNKNKLWNLVSLCKECHQSVHSSPARIKINGYITTSTGIELNFVNSSDDMLCGNEIVESIDISSVEVPIPVSTKDIDDVEIGNVNIGNVDIDMVEEDMAMHMKLVSKQMANLDKTASNSNKKGNQKEKQKVILELRTISEENKNVILEMKKNNATPKKIQFDMKRHYNVDISQQAIRELHNQ